MLPLAAALCCLGAGTASAAPVFHPRVGGALGLMPPINRTVSFPPMVRTARGVIPVTYHGGRTMTGGITVHTIFWTGGTRPFKPQPKGAPHDYVGMIEQYFADAADASTGTKGASCTVVFCDNLTVEPQYAWGTRPGHITSGDYSIAYHAGKDAVVDKHRYPAKSHQCQSPSQEPVCLTDAQIQRELNRVIKAHGGARGLHNLWYVFLPPKVDECISAGACGTNDYSGYHSVSDLGHGPVIYALTIDPSIEGHQTRGRDPEGFPDAESAIDIAAHETNEAISDPEGVGYMDPNGYEIGDKCQSHYGKSLGTAGPDNAPYNQVINGHKYLTQEMWANRDNGGHTHCVEATTNTTTPLPLPQVDLTQFSAKVTGNIRRDKAGVKVKVTLLRESAAGKAVVVAHATATTHSNGSWSLSLAKHAVGDDRDKITVQYSGTGAPSPRHETILTGNGGNPFTESGWTGWYDMDHGSFVSDHPPTLSLAPCFQTGVEAYTLAGVPGPESPTDFCGTKTDAARTPLSAAPGRGKAIVWSSNDDRAFTPGANTLGALIKLAAPAGEPGSVSRFKLPLPPRWFTPGGFPTCTANLVKHRVSCQGLVPGESYKLRAGSKHASAKADGKGVVSVRLAAKGGHKVSLSNGARTLTVLHVAHLSRDHCQPGEYFGGPVAKAPTNGSAGTLAGGTALTGMICPLSGNRKGLPAAKTNAQTDEFSGGETIYK